MTTSSRKTAKVPQKAAAVKTAPAKSRSRTEEAKGKQPIALDVSLSSATTKAMAKQQPAEARLQAQDKMSAKEKLAKEKTKKAKLVRDSFTMPEDEYQALGDLKKACVKAGFEVKKSELLRIGVALLKKLPPPQIQQALSALPPLKAGRPKKDK